MTSSHEPIPTAPSQPGGKPGTGLDGEIAGVPSRATLAGSARADAVAGIGRTTA